MASSPASAIRWQATEGCPQRAWVDLSRLAACQHYGHDAHDIARYTAVLTPSEQIGRAMLRSLSAAVALLGSLIAPVAAQDASRASECLAMANAPPRAVPVSLRAA